MGYHGQGPPSYHTISLILWIRKSVSKDTLLQDLQSPWRHSEDWHNDEQNYDILLSQSYAEMSPSDLYSLGFLPAWGILNYIFLTSLKQGQWYGWKKSTTDTWTVSIMLTIAIYSCAVVCNQEWQLYETLFIYCTCVLSGWKHIKK